MEYADNGDLGDLIYKKTTLLKKLKAKRKK